LALKNIIVDARKFSSSRGAFLALLEHVRLLKSSGFKVHLLVDETTKRLAVDERVDDCEFIIIDTLFGIYVEIFLSILKFDRVSIFCPHAVSFGWHLPFLPFVNIFYWVQGLVSDEMETRSERRFRILIMRLLERLSYKRANFCIVVSNAMKKELENRYGPRKNIHIIPCLPRLTPKVAPKIPHSFCYIGGMSPWQKVDQALEFFNKYIELHPSATFKIATNDIKSAQSKIDRYASKIAKRSIAVLSLDTKEEVSDFLSDTQFGFLLRDDLPLNRVASPIKFGEYLSCGVSVIISPKVGDYSDLVCRYDAGFIWSSGGSIDGLRYNNQGVQNLYQDFFNDDKFKIIYKHDC